MFTILYTGSFKKDFKRISKRNYNIDLLKTTLELLTKEGALPQTYKPHILSGNFSSLWECHIKSDWLLIWSIDLENKTITLYRTGTHADLF